MNKSDLAKSMRQFVQAEFVTRGELAKFLGYKDPHNVDRYIRDLQRVAGTRYYIPEVAESIMQDYQ